MSRKLRNGLIGTAAGLGVAALLLPAVAGGNARPDPDFEVPLVARLSGAAEVPPADPDGTGAAAITINLAGVNPGTICYDLAVAGIGPASAAHIHQGIAGANGPVVVTLDPPSGGSSSNCVQDAVNAPLIAANPAGYYVNVHNAEFVNGAVRGQLAVGPASNNTYLLGAPLRAFDSRGGTSPTKLAPGETRTVSLQSGLAAGGVSTLAVPPGATAALVTLTVTETEAAGFVKIYSAAIAEPPTSNINWSEAGQNLAVATTVAVDAQSAVKITGGFGATHVVIDVVGFLY